MEDVEGKVLVIGLLLAGYTLSNQQKSEQNTRRFHGMYGSSPRVVSKIWHDLLGNNAEVSRMKATEGIKWLFLALYFLKCYPTEEAVAGRFGMSEKSARKWVWFFITKIQSLKVIKVSGIRLYF
jgi:hypothetical protein